MTLRSFGYLRGNQKELKAHFKQSIIFVMVNLPCKTINSPNDDSSAIIPAPFLPPYPADSIFAKSQCINDLSRNDDTNWKGILRTFKQWLALTMRVRYWISIVNALK